VRLISYGGCMTEPYDDEADDDVNPCIKTAVEMWN